MTDDTAKEAAPLDPIEVFGDQVGLKTLEAKMALREAILNLRLLDGGLIQRGPTIRFGMFGIIVNMDERFERLKNTFQKKRGKVLNEDLKLALREISNLSLQALLIDAGKWPGQ